MIGGDRLLISGKFQAELLFHLHNISVNRLGTQVAPYPEAYSSAGSRLAPIGDEGLDSAFISFVLQTLNPLVYHNLAPSATVDSPLFDIDISHYLSNVSPPSSRAVSQTGVSPRRTKPRP